MKRTLIALLAASSLVVGACAADGADDAQDNTTNAPTTEGESGGSGENASDDVARFGELESPCGPGDATVDPADAGRGTDKLYIAVASDRASFRSGLNQELWDSSTAFVDWCNAQGGVSGLELEAIDVDGKLFEIESAMATVCSDAFALVGGGWAQDDMAFTGRPDSDFDLCSQIAIPGFSVSERFSLNDRVVNPLPNDPALRPMSHFEAFAEAFPDEAQNFAIVYGQIQSMEDNAAQNKAALEKIDGYGEIKTLVYDVVSQDWSVLAQQVKAAGITGIAYVGEPQNLSTFSQELKDQSWPGRIIGETNIYDQRFFDINGPEAVEGVVVRGVFPPFEEAEQWPLTKEFMSILDEYSPGWPNASLAVHSFSASLMFATAAKACAQDGPITRDCVLAEASSYTEWTAGGLHPSGNPAKRTPSKCNMLLEVVGGKFQRLAPQIDGDGDDELGLTCSDLIDIS